jgi:hypothetical protein
MLTLATVAGIALYVAAGALAGITRGTSHGFGEALE